MKKIIRTAIVLALAGAALLTAGCTKDASNDIKVIQGQVTNLEAAVSALQAFKTTAEAQIKANSDAIGILNNDVVILDSKIKELEVATDDAIEALATEIEKEITKIYTQIEAVVGRVAALEADYAAASQAIKALKKQIDSIAARIVSIVAVPSTTAEIINVTAPGIGATDTTVRVFCASFEVSPAEAADALKDGDLTITYREGLAKATPVYEEGVAVNILSNVKGMVTVSAFAPAKAISATNKLYYSLSFEGKDASDSVYSVQSAYTPAAFDSKTVQYAVAHNGELVVPQGGVYEVTDTVVYTNVHDVLFTKDVELVAICGVTKMTMDEYAKFLGLAKAPAVSFADTSSAIDAGATAFTIKKDTIAINGKKAKADIGKAASIWGEYTINKKATGVKLMKTARIYKDVKSDIDVLPAVSIKWNYLSGDKTGTATYKVPAPKIYNGKTQADAVKIALLDSKGKEVATTKYAATFAAANDTALVSLNIAWAKTAQTFDYDLAFVNDTIAYACDVPFEIGAQPADQKVVLADSTVAYKTSNIVSVKSPLVVAAIADTTYYKGDLKNVKATDIYNHFSAQPIYGFADSIYCEGARVDTGAVAKKVSAEFVFGAGDYKNAGISLYNVRAGKTYTVYKKVAVSGVKYSYVQNITIGQTTFNIATDPLFVSAGVVTLKGNVNSNVYSIDKAELANYFKVDGTIPAGSYMEMHFNLLNEFGVKKDSAGANNLPTNPDAEAVNISTGRIANSSFTWNGFTASKMLVQAWLENASNTLIGDTITIALVTPQPVVNFKGGEIAKDRVNGQDLVINLWSDIFASSCLADTNIFNPKAETLAAAAVKKISYGQEINYTWDITAAKPTVKAELNGQPYTLDANYFSVADGKLTIKKECGLFTAPLKITIPVTVNYYLDYAHKQALKSEVVVTVTQK